MGVPKGQSRANTAHAIIATNATIDRIERAATPTPGNITGKHHTSITNNAATTEVKAIVKYGDATIAIQTHWTDLTRDD
jgi:hypothetical protein